MSQAWLRGWPSSAPHWEPGVQWVGEPPGEVGRAVKQEGQCNWVEEGQGSGRRAGRGEARAVSLVGFGNRTPDTVTRILVSSALFNVPFKHMPQSQVRPVTSLCVGVAQDSWCGRALGWPPACEAARCPCCPGRRCPPPGPGLFPTASGRFRFLPARWAAPLTPRSSSSAHNPSLLLPPGPPSAICHPVCRRQVGGFRAGQGGGRWVPGGKVLGLQP